MAVSRFANNPYHGYTMDSQGKYVRDDGQHLITTNPPSRTFGGLNQFYTRQQNNGSMDDVDRATQAINRTGELITKDGQRVPDTWENRGFVTHLSRTDPNPHAPVAPAPGAGGVPPPTPPVAPGAGGVPPPAAPAAPGAGFLPKNSVTDPNTKPFNGGGAAPAGNGGGGGKAPDKNDAPPEEEKGSGETSDEGYDGDNDGGDDDPPPTPEEKAGPVPQAPPAGAVAPVYAQTDHSSAAADDAGGLMGRASNSPYSDTLTGISNFSQPDSGTIKNLPSAFPTPQESSYSRMYTVPKGPTSMPSSEGGMGTIQGIPPPFASQQGPIKLDQPPIRAAASYRAEKSPYPIKPVASPFQAQADEIASRRDFARGEAPVMRTFDDGSQYPPGVRQTSGRAEKMNPYGSATATYGPPSAQGGTMPDPLNPGRTIPVRQWTADQSAVQATKYGPGASQAGEDYLNPKKVTSASTPIGSMPLGQGDANKFRSYARGGVVPTKKV